jgi:hypothetical protein
MCKREFGFAHVFGLCCPTMRRDESTAHILFHHSYSCNLCLGQSLILNAQILFRWNISLSLYKGPRSHLLIEYSEGTECLSLLQEIDSATAGAVTAIISSIGSQKECKCDFSYPDTSHSKHVHAFILQSCLVMQRIHYEKARLGNWDFHIGGRSKMRRERSIKFRNYQETYNKIDTCFLYTSHQLVLMRMSNLVSPYF